MSIKAKEIDRTPSKIRLLLHFPLKTPPAFDKVFILKLKKVVHNRGQPVDNFGYLSSYQQLIPIIHMPTPSLQLWHSSENVENF
jgi:hypothetical protein